MLNKTKCKNSFFLPGARAALTTGIDRLRQKKKKNLNRVQSVYAESKKLIFIGSHLLQIYPRRYF